MDARGVVPLGAPDATWRETMVHLLSSERPFAAAPTSGLMAALAGWLRKTRTARRQRIALSTLLEYDGHQLDDIGIDRQDLFDAMTHPSQRAGAILNQRRARRARLWLDP
jgi:uncharacterized protein YjiS (DUF1127 family)